MSPDWNRTIYMDFRAELNQTASYRLADHQPFRELVGLPCRIPAHMPANDLDESARTRFYDDLATIHGVLSQRSFLLHDFRSVLHE